MARSLAWWTKAWPMMLTVLMLIVGVDMGHAQVQQPLRPRFNMPPAGARFVPNEIILDSFPTVPTPTLEAIAQRHRMTRLETQVFSLTGRRMHRWRLDGGGTVEAMIRGVNGESQIAGAQPNYLYTLEEVAAAAPVTNEQYVPRKLMLEQAHKLSTGNRIL